MLPDWLQTLVICACFVRNCFRLKREALGALLDLLAIAQTMSTPGAPLAHSLSPAETPSPAAAARSLPTSTSDSSSSTASATPPEAAAASASASLRGSQTSQEVDSKEKESGNSRDAFVADSTSATTAPPDLLRNTPDAVQPPAQQSHGTSGGVSTITIMFESVSDAQLDFLRHRSAFYFVSSSFAYYCLLLRAG